MVIKGVTDYFRATGDGRRESKDRTEMYWMCCTVAFSTRRSKQSHLLVPSLVSQFCSTKEVQQQEKGQFFQEEIQALRSEASSDAVSSHRETSGGAHPLQTAVCFVKSLGCFRPDFSNPDSDVAACASLQSCTEAFWYLRHENVIKNSLKWEGSTSSPASQHSCGGDC